MSDDAKVRPDRDQLTGALRRAGVAAPERARFEEVTAGTFNTVYRVVTADGRRLVLKIAPPAAVAGMSYEHDLQVTEAAFYRAAARALPVPEVVHADFGRDVLPSDWLLMTELPGENWYDSRDRIDATGRAALRERLGELVAGLHRVTGDGFGYPQDGLVADWPTAFTAMLEAVLADADRYAVDPPVSADRLRRLLAASREALVEVTTPSLVHFDLWAGNVLVDPAAARVTGVVDGERALWGDPLLDMPSLALFARVEDDADFLAGYRRAGGALDTAAATTLRRLDLYRCYLYLVMAVEAVPRGATGPEDEAFRDLVARQLRLAADRLDGGTTT
ncbi:phosphotransferase family protein [Saccharothrix yanglingensis]|uniref:Phosphotransferase n=1 Tax=Saccharothrix yanglingensis TaxID=659496 RepID=A0ABU0X3I3_9PSEU|nr:aminoglycoside phosphotransferase family protein [Saccharothrix yanglingensis]MDQ2586689.1 phosphotransferase [Saccharothrix yanglingensis]